MRLSCAVKWLQNPEEKLSGPGVKIYLQNVRENSNNFPKTFVHKCLTSSENFEISLKS